MVHIFVEIILVGVYDPNVRVRLVPKDTTTSLIQALGIGQNQSRSDLALALHAFWLFNAFPRREAGSQPKAIPHTLNPKPYTLYPIPPYPYTRRDGVVVGGR